MSIEDSIKRSLICVVEVGIGNVGVFHVESPALHGASAELGAVAFAVNGILAGIWGG